MESYSFWTDEVLHTESDQLKRQISALGKKLTPFDVDVKSQTCRIKGSGKEAYVISLTDCTCNDFVKRRLPCKHMYRLAHELGIFALQGMPAVSSIVKISSENGVDKYIDTENSELLTYNMDDIERRAEMLIQFTNGLSYEKLLQLRQSVRGYQNYEIGTVWREATLDKDYAELMLDSGLYEEIKAAATEKLEHLDRHYILLILDVLDKENRINRRPQTKTLLKIIKSDFANEIETINDKIFYLESTPVFWLWGAVFKHIRRLFIKRVLCQDCNSVYSGGLTMEEVQYAESPTYCYNCGDRL